MVKRIRLEKITELPDAVTPNNINVGEVRTGVITRSPEIGRGLLLKKDNGGYFITSPVTEIFDIFRFKTQNSIYKIEYL